MPPTQHVCTRLRSIETRLTVAVLAFGTTVDRAKLRERKICDVLPHVREVGIAGELGCRGYPVRTWPLRYKGAGLTVGEVS